MSTIFSHVYSCMPSRADASAFVSQAADTICRLGRTIQKMPIRHKVALGAAFGLSVLATATKAASFLTLSDTCDAHQPPTCLPDYNRTARLCESCLQSGEWLKQSARAMPYLTCPNWYADHPTIWRMMYRDGYNAKDYKELNCGQLMGEPYESLTADHFHTFC